MQGIARSLVPVDFSEPSRKAVRYGLSLAVEADAALILAHVVPFAPHLPYARPFGSATLEQSDREGVVARLGEFVDGELGGAVEIECLVRSGDVQDEILEVARDRDVDLVVMGTHGRRRFERWLLGSIAEGVLRKSSVPVLTVSHLDAEHVLASPGPVPLKKILVATDLTSGDDAVTRTMDWARELSAEVLILHVVAPLRMALSPVNAALEAQVDLDAIRRGAVERLQATVP
jgi:nucleotide-binding universal stress UspA family protein